MAESKIEDLAELTTVVDIDVLAIVDDPDGTPVTKKVTRANLLTGGDHGSFAGLTDDDHTQYARLLGRVGGQIIIGGTASGNNLELQSTSHATKGTISLGGVVVADVTNGRCTVQASGDVTLRVKAVSPGTNQGPIRDMYRDSTLVFEEFYNTTSKVLNCALQEANSLMQFQVGNGGSWRLQADGGMLVGSPTGGSQGLGTLNAKAVYDDGALLTCYVIAAANGQQIDVDRLTALGPADSEGRKRRHTPAERFKLRNQNGSSDLDPTAYAAAWKASGHLPAFPSEAQWANRKLSVGDLLQRVIETCEVQAVHIDKINRRLKLLEGVL